MNTRKIFFLFILVLASLLPLSGLTTVTIGTGTLTGFYPLLCYDTPSARKPCTGSNRVFRALDYQIEVVSQYLVQSQCHRHHGKLAAGNIKGFFYRGCVG